ncbi:hypothetical protein GCM10008956_27410 [Deinococcus arenae]|uniref:Uncharacterized protein n=1 Tax=Deinococcus arenae TaxID=1452751 RepID=A0A8H9GV83_9DEIO|nr:hypothetical protein GCM10008956_27410 [Deinococcus arenae]
MGAAPRGAPGWPLLAACTPSMLRVRMVLTLSCGMSLDMPSSYPEKSMCTVYTFWRFLDARVKRSHDRRGFTCQKKRSRRRGSGDHADSEPSVLGSRHTIGASIPVKTEYARDRMIASPSVNIH